PLLFGELTLDEEGILPLKRAKIGSVKRAHCNTSGPCARSPIYIGRCWTSRVSTRWAGADNQCVDERRQPSRRRERNDDDQTSKKRILCLLDARPDGRL